MTEEFPPLTDEEVRDLGYEPTERGWVPGRRPKRERITFVCAAGKHTECFRPTCTCECHEGGDSARRRREPTPVGGVGQELIPEVSS